MTDVKRPEDEDGEDFFLQRAFSQSNQQPNNTPGMSSGQGEMLRGGKNQQQQMMQALKRNFDSLAKNQNENEDQEKEMEMERENSFKKTRMDKEVKE